MRKSRIKIDNPRLYRFRREEHLKGRTRIRDVFDKGRQFVVKQGQNRSLKLFVLLNNLPYNRICFTCAGGRKFGNAVERNRAKRLGREAYRLIKGGQDQILKCGYDLILLIYPDKDTRKSLSLMIDDLRLLFFKAGLLEK